MTLIAAPRGQAKRSTMEVRMRMSKRAAMAMLSVAALAGSAVTAVNAAGSEDGGGHAGNRGAALLDSSLAPSVPSDPKLNGAAAGNVPWMLRDGEARLRRDGRLRVRIRGLVIPGNGTPRASDDGQCLAILRSSHDGCGHDPVGPDIAKRGRRAPGADQRTREVPGPNRAGSPERQPGRLHRRQRVRRIGANWLCPPPPRPGIADGQSRVGR